MQSQRAGLTSNDGTDADAESESGLRSEASDSGVTKTLSTVLVVLISNDFALMKKFRPRHMPCCIT